MQRPQPEPGLGQLVAELVAQFELLVSQHIRLAREELSADGRKVAFHAGGLVLGLLLLVMGLAFVGVALLVLLQLLLPTWAAALLVAALFLIAGGTIAAGSLRSLRSGRGRALEQAQETITWLTGKK